MTEQMAKLLVDAIEGCGHEVSLRNNYIPRSRQTPTFGVVVESPSVVIEGLLHYFKTNIEEASFMDGGEQEVMEYTGNEIPEISSFSIDTMGRDAIIY